MKYLEYLFLALENKARRMIVVLEKLLKSRKRSIFIDFPPSPRPRYGHGHPPHPELYQLMDKGREEYILLLDQFEAFSTHLAAISSDRPVEDVEPFWNNGWLGGTNAIALYCLPAIHNSKRYVEIGSGNSTKFVRRSIKDHSLPTCVISIDPHPRAEIDRLCDTAIRAPLEDVDLAIFDTLEVGDIVCFDGSHRCFQNSDVTVFFLEILPRLKSGVIVYIDDIFLPYDYPKEWLEFYYSEQYMLAAMLLADNGKRYKIMLPNVFIEHDAVLGQKERELWAKINHPGFSGNGLWLQVR